MRLLIVLSLLLQCHFVSADEKEDRWRHFYENIAKQYSISIDGNPATELTLSKYPALVWSNPARAGDTHGAFWVWTNGGRPEAVGTIFSYLSGASSRVVAHEFHSLSRSALTARLNDRVVWTPAKNGVQWTPLADVRPAPKLAISTPVTDAHNREAIRRDGAK